MAVDEHLRHDDVVASQTLLQLVVILVVEHDVLLLNAHTMRAKRQQDHPALLVGLPYSRKARHVNNDLSAAPVGVGSFLLRQQYAMKALVEFLPLTDLHQSKDATALRFVRRAFLERRQRRRDLVLKTAHRAAFASYFAFRRRRGGRHERRQVGDEIAVVRFVRARIGRRGEAICGRDRCHGFGRS